MGKYFKTADGFYKVMVPFFEKLINDTEVGDKLSAFKHTFQLLITQPDAKIVLDCRNSEKKVVCGETDLEGDIQLKMRSDSAHRLLLGKMILRDASMAREIIARGPLDELKELSSIFLAASKFYKHHLMQMGYKAHIKN